MHSDKMMEGPDQMTYGPLDEGEPQETLEERFEFTRWLVDNTPDYFALAANLARAAARPK